MERSLRSAAQEIDPPSRSGASAGFRSEVGASGGSALNLGLPAPCRGRTPILRAPSSDTDESWRRQCPLPRRIGAHGNTFRPNLGGRSGPVAASFGALGDLVAGFLIASFLGQTLHDELGACSASASTLGSSACAVGDARQTARSMQCRQFGVRFVGERGRRPQALTVRALVFLKRVGPWIGSTPMLGLWIRCVRVPGFTSSPWWGQAGVLNAGFGPHQQGMHSARSASW